MLHADLVLINGNIITMNPRQAKAQAAAIKDGKIVAIGSNKQILLYRGKSTRRIDLKGKTLVPGFIDTHVHGASLGRCLSQVNLRGVKSIKEMQRKVKQWASKTSKREWIIGRGWDQDRLKERRYPSRWDLDQAAPTNPVFLIRVCGHAGVANTEALELAGITRRTKAPEGGCIDRDSETKEPNGILRENALDLIFEVLPEASEEILMDTCVCACRKMVEEGITTAHWIISSPNEIRILQKLKGRRMLPLRIYALIPVEHLDRLIELGLSAGFGDHRIKIGGVKILTDGSLGARTAALKEPYDDAPDTCGILLYSQRQLEKLAERAHEAGLQLAIHAIGDKTIELALKTLEKVLAKTSEKKHRHRLEHVSVLNPRLVRKMKQLGVVASVQPHFIISDFWIVDRLGTKRGRWTYALKSLLKMGVRAMGGSDAPIEPVSPVLGIYAAVARESYPEERLTVEEALRLYTVNAAYGSFEEKLKGSIEKGKLADLVVLSHDPFKMHAEQIKGIKVEMTVVDGEIVYRRP
jgi:predicted amidohydrolase YtcJ